MTGTSTPGTRRRARDQPGPGGWTYVVVDGIASTGSCTDRGDGAHTPPVRADVRRRIGEGTADRVSVGLTERLGPPAR